MRKRESEPKIDLDVDRTKVELQLPGKTEEELDAMKKRAQRFAVPVKMKLRCLPGYVSNDRVFRKKTISLTHSPPLTHSLHQ